MEQEFKFFHYNMVSSNVLFTTDDGNKNPPKNASSGNNAEQAEQTPANP